MSPRPLSLSLSPSLSLPLLLLFMTVNAIIIIMLFYIYYLILCCINLNLVFLYFHYFVALYSPYCVILCTTYGVYLPPFFPSFSPFPSLSCLCCPSPSLPASRHRSPLPPLFPPLATAHPSHPSPPLATSRPSPSPYPHLTPPLLYLSLLPSPPPSLAHTLNLCLNMFYGNNGIYLDKVVFVYRLSSLYDYNLLLMYLMF